MKLAFQQFANSNNAINRANHDSASTEYHEPVYEEVGEAFKHFLHAPPFYYEYPLSTTTKGLNMSTTTNTLWIRGK